MYLFCFDCQKQVSTLIPDNTVIRAIIICPECYEKFNYENDRDKESLSNLASDAAKKLGW